MQSQETTEEVEQSESSQSPEQQYWREFEQLINDRVAQAESGESSEPPADAWEQAYRAMADIVVTQFALYSSMRLIEDQVYSQLDDKEE